MTRDQIIKGTRIMNAEDCEGACRLGGGVIKGGELVAFPTETVYGLGADALNLEAVRKIFEAKGRPPDNPLIVHVSTIEDVEGVAENIPEIACKLIDALWPGPLTLVLRRKNIVPGITAGGLDTVAVRMPKHPVALRLIEAAGTPVAAPSANTSGKPSPTTAQHVIDDLAGRIDLVIDGGRVEVGVESTVLDVTTPVPVLLRPGGVGIEKLEELIGIIRVSSHESDSVPRSPGMKYTHYSPEAKVVLVTGDNAASTILRLSEEYAKSGSGAGLLLCSENADVFRGEVRKIILGSKNDPGSIAKNLFYSLRLLDSQGVKVIIADGSFSETGVGLAVMNRLKKAASKIIRT